MPLQTFRQIQVIKVVETIDRVPESLVIFLLNQQIVVSVVDSLNVQLSRGEQSDRDR